MTRWVIRYPAVNEAPSGDLDRVALDRDVRVIDRAAEGLALVEVPDRALPRLRELLPGWTIQREQEGRLPE